jgi:hypothetical protein
MRISRTLLAALLAFAGLGAQAGPAMAAGTVEVQGTGEVTAPDGKGHLLIVFGQNLTRVTAFTLEETGGAPVGTLAVAFRSKTVAGLLLPAGFETADRPLPADFALKFATRTSTDAIVVRIAAGHPESQSVCSASLEEELREDLDRATWADNAGMVGGEIPSQLHEAGRLTGTVPSSRFSAFDDLSEEGKVGSGWNQVAQGSHNHDARYLQPAALSAPGVINAEGNPVEWSQLRGVPSGIADGVDDGGLGTGIYLPGDGLTLLEGVFAADFAGTGVTKHVARADHHHGSVYYTKGQLAADGGIVNDPDNPVDWSRLKGMPASFADGRDEDTTYAAGRGLGMAWNTFYLLFEGSGANVTVARGDHTHANYLDPSGGAITTRFDFSTSGDAIVATTGNTTVPGSGTTNGGIDSTSAQGTGLAGHGNIGVLGDLDGDGTYGVWGKAPFAGQTGVYASADGDYGTGLLASASGRDGVGLKAYSTGSSGRAIVASTSYRYSTTMGIYGAYLGTAARFNAGRYGTGVYAYSYRGTALSAQVNGYATTGLRVDGSYTRNLATFQRYGSNVIRFTSGGRGYFNGGTYSWGADFAESVKVDRAAEEFEPGDVMIIDATSRRRFSRSREANSTLVAGVVSTRPAMVGTTHEVAGPTGARMLDGEVKLGIVGIVPTKVCDQGGGIRAGDLLVSSSLPGHAMKAPANPAAGTVIGKALEGLPKGTGKVEVLLMAR